MKKGFSLVEVMIIFTVLSVILAASIPMISKKANPIQNKVSHGVYRCIQVNTDNGDSELVEELYSGTRQIKSDSVNKCTFRVPQAAQYKIDMYSAGTGGTKFAMVNSQRDDSRVHTYTMAGGMDNGNVDPILKPNDSELAKMFNGKVVVRSAYTGDAGNGGNADLTYESPYEANCGIESADRKVLTEEINKLKEELEEKQDLLDKLNNLNFDVGSEIKVWDKTVLNGKLENLGPAGRDNFDERTNIPIYNKSFNELYTNNNIILLFHGGGGKIVCANVERPGDSVWRKTVLEYIFYGSRCAQEEDLGYILDLYYKNWPENVLLMSDSDFNNVYRNTYNTAKSYEYFTFPRLVRIIRNSFQKSLKYVLPNEVKHLVYDNKITYSDALRIAEVNTIKKYYYTALETPDKLLKECDSIDKRSGETHCLRRADAGDITGLYLTLTKAARNGRLGNSSRRYDEGNFYAHYITFLAIDNYYGAAVYFRDVVDDFINAYYEALGLDKVKEELEKEIKELEDRIYELENEYKLDSYLKYNKYSKVPFTSIYSDSKLVVNSNVRTQVAEFCNMVFKNYYKLATEKRGRTIKAEDTIRFGEKRVANFGGDSGKGVYSRIKIKINYKPSKSGNTTSFADYAKNLLSEKKGYYPVVCTDKFGKDCTPYSAIQNASNGTDITANYKNRENKSLFEIVTQIALKGYELFSKAVTKLADSVYIHPDDGYTPGTTHSYDPYRPENKTCDGKVFYNYSDYVEYMDAHCTCKSLEYAQTHPFECKNQIDPPINTFVACDGTQFNDQNLLRQYEATVGCNCANPKYAATHPVECKNQEIHNDLVACDGTPFPINDFVGYMAYVEEHCQEDNPITRTYKACDGTVFDSIMEYEAYTSTVVCNCTNPKYAHYHPIECTSPTPNPITSGNKRILKTTDGTSLTYPYIGWHISGVTTPKMPIKTMPTGGERKKIYVDETNEQMQYISVVNGEVLENMYSVYSNYIFGKNYANSIGETIPKNGSNVVMDTSSTASSTENYKIDTASPSSVSVSPANGLDSGSINLSWQEPKLVINSTLWTKQYELGAPGKTGNSISFTATDLGKECTFQVAPRGKVYAKTGDTTKDRATRAELDALLKTSMECKNRDNKVVFSHSVAGKEYTDGIIQSPQTFEWSEKLETEIKQFTAEQAEGVKEHKWKRTSMWAKIFQFMTVKETSEYDLTSKGVGQAGTGTTLIDKCVARRGLYEATTYYMMQYLKEDQAETKLPANGIQYTDDTVTGLRRIPRIVSTSNVDKKIATERHSLQEGNQSGFNCYGVEDPSDENVSSATMVITQDSPIVQKGLMDLIIEKGGGGAVVITW